MAYKIIWSPRGILSFEETCNYIAKDSEFYAALFAKNINAIIKSLPQFPKSGRVAPEYKNENIREKIYQSYRIVYRLKEDVIEIVAVTHGARQLQDIL